MKHFPWTDYPVLACSFGSHEPVVSRVREVLPAWAAILKGSSLAIVGNVAMT